MSVNSSEISGERLLRQILQAVADRSGFLVEDRLNILLAPYTRSQNTLVRIDNVFNVSIGVHVYYGSKYFQMLPVIQLTNIL